MIARLLTSTLALCCAQLLAQAPTAPSPAANSPHTSALGFTYSLPSDWEIIGEQPSLADAKAQQAQNATTEEEKKGLACVQIALTARHGDPASVVVVMDLPFDCFGQVMTDKDLPGFAQGASEGLAQNFDVGEPVYGAYSLDTHQFWIERTSGTPKGHPELKFTLEITCSLLKKGAVCWMSLAADENALHTFENGKVALDGDDAPALVPSTAFDKKPGAPQPAS
jgi:hypothetical protein